MVRFSVPLRRPPRAFLRMGRLTLPGGNRRLLQLLAAVDLDAEVIAAGLPPRSMIPELEHAGCGGAIWLVALQHDRLSAQLGIEAHRRFKRANFDVHVHPLHGSSPV